MILANGHWILLCLLTSTTAFTTTLTKRTTTTKSPSRRASFSKIRQSQKLNRLPSHLKLSSFTVSNDEELTVGIEAINLSNNDLMAKLETLCDQPYFRLYSVDILGSCEYMPQELFECYTESCEIYPEEEEDVSVLL